MTQSIPAIAGSGRSVLALYLLAAAVDASAQTAPTSTSGWVVIPINEYNSLRARAFPAPKLPDPPPVEATVTRVDYDMKVEGDLASGSAVLTVDVLRDGWVRIPIPAGLMVREARMGSQLVPLVRGTGQVVAMLSQRGRSVVRLEIAMPVTSAAGEERISLPSSTSGITRAALAVPRQDVDLKVTGGLLGERVEGEADSRWVAYARGGEPLSFAWRRKVEERRDPLPLRFRGDLTQVIGLGEDSTSIYAEVNVEVMQGVARQVRVQLPPAVTVNQVPGANVADWEVKQGELTVSFLEPVEQKTGFVIQGETTLAREGSIVLPLMRLLDAERETGGVAVEVMGAGEIKSLRSEGLERADAAELGAALAARQSPSLVAFRFRSGQTTARALAIDVVRYTQQAVLTANIEEARYRVLMSVDGKTLVEARYAVRSTQRSFLRIGLPEKSTLWSASIAGVPVRPGNAPDGKLLLPLDRVRGSGDAPAFAVELVYLTPGTVWTEKGRASLALPELDLPVSRIGVVLFHAPEYRLTPDTGEFRVGTYEEPSAQALIAVAAATPASAPGQQTNAGAAQALVDRYRARNEARRPPGRLTVSIGFPAVGPSLFLTGEMTAENRAPSIGINFQKDRKGGVQ